MWTKYLCIHLKDGPMKSLPEFAKFRFLSISAKFCSRQSGHTVLSWVTLYCRGSHCTVVGLSLSHVEIIDCHMESLKLMVMFSGLL